MARFRHQPRTEQEVVCLFIELLDEISEFPKPVVIDEVRNAYPDCTISVEPQATKVRIEFELYSSRFDHDEAGCDWIVCWRDDRGSWPGRPKMLELAEVVGRRAKSPVLGIDEERPATPDGFMASAAREGTSARDLELIRHVLKRAAEREMGPIWLEGSNPVFAVGRGQHFFKVGSTGAITLPLDRLQERGPLGELIARLNQVAPALSLTSADAQSKKKGGQLSQLFGSHEQLDEFFDVWSWFADGGPSGEA